MEIFNCSYSKIVEIDHLVENPKNTNTHPERQVEMLAKIISYQGQRSPIIVSNRSGFIVKGHCRLLALKALGWSKVAVDYQDYDSEAQEFADLVADNKIASLASHNDERMVDFLKNDLDLIDFDFELLGFTEFEMGNLFDPDDGTVTDASEEWVGMPEFSEESKMAYRHLIVHFENAEDVKNFFDAIGQQDTGNTKTIWFPPQDRMDTKTRSYE